jgi:hypothetical protein
MGALSSVRARRHPFSADDDIGRELPHPSGRSGDLGTVLTALIGARHEEQRNWREVLRTACASFTSHVSELQDLSHQLREDPGNPDLQQAAQQAHTRARGFYEQLRLTSRSVETQEAARWVIHCIYYQWQATPGGRGDFWEARNDLGKWMTKLYVEARRNWAWALRMFTRTR